MKFRNLLALILVVLFAGSQVVYAEGDRGDKGDRGEQGYKGDRGDKGKDGVSGRDGDKGDRGAKGDTGEVDYSRLDPIIQKNVQQDTTLTDHTNRISLTEAMNDQQNVRLDANDTMNAQQNVRLHNLETNVRKIQAGISAGAASANLVFDPNYRYGQVSVGVANFNGSNAIAIGTGVKIGNRTFLQGNVSVVSGSKGIVGAGANFKF